jgi:hypothetical protein
MSKEEKDRAKIDDLIYDIDREGIYGIMQSAIAYGRANPDREMLIALLSFAEDYDREQAREGIRPTYAKIVNQFLTLENQRGEK